MLKKDFAKKYDEYLSEGLWLLLQMKSIGSISLRDNRADTVRQPETLAGYCERILETYQDLQLLHGGPTTGSPSDQQTHHSRSGPHLK